MKVITGLGNPGEKYSQTRHNVGFMVLDSLAKEKNLTWETNKKLKAQIIRTSDFILIKPLTYMNNSGQAVAAVLSYFKLLPKKLGVIKIKDSDLAESLTVIHDDLDLLFGDYKISTDSRAGGHNGVQSIIDHLKTKKFRRIRVGIKTEERERIPADKFVLANFRKEELIVISEITKKIFSII